MVDQRVALRQEARRRAVLDAAVAVFSARGYRAASMADIARKLGMGKASLYHYVSSKDEILVELYEDVLRESVISARRIAESERFADWMEVREYLGDRRPEGSDAVEAREELLSDCLDRAASVTWACSRA